LTDESPNTTGSPRQEPAEPARTGIQLSVLDPDEARLWAEYRESGSSDAREALILNYVPLVRYVASQVVHSVPPSVEFGDLVGYGVFGLLDALDKFDEEAGAKFETYAIIRIKGAMLDGLRSEDWVPQSVRKGARTINRAIETLLCELKRTPDDHEVAEQLGMELYKYRELQGKIALVSVIALDEPVRSGSDGDISLWDRLADESAGDPSSLAEEEQTRKAILDALDMLTERQRVMVYLHYFEGLSVVDIAQALCLSDNRVRQIHTKALIKLRGRMSKALAWS
jgi:RNA polymerase sigma factor for flagellar operon FliA